MHTPCLMPFFTRFSGSPLGAESQLLRDEGGLCMVPPVSSVVLLVPGHRSSMPPGAVPLPSCLIALLAPLLPIR